MVDKQSVDSGVESRGETAPHGRALLGSEKRRMLTRESPLNGTSPDVLKVSPAGQARGTYGNVGCMYSFIFWSEMLWKQ